jgi:4-hydroxy-tetrahydrodipicolinate synthase
MFKGSMVAIVTPFHKGKIDKVKLRKLLDFQLKNGTDAIVPCGTTGEAATMSHEEHKMVLSFVKEYVGNKVPVICGAGSNNTEEAVALSKHAKKINAAAVLSVVPYYNKPTQNGLYQHFEYIAKKVDIPIVLYNVPGRSSVALDPATAIRLSRIPNIVAIKEASGSLDSVSHILSECDLAVFSGDDSLTLPMMALGGKGVISVSANIVPDRIHALTEACLNGEWEKARALHLDLYALNKAMFLETNPIPVKSALFLMKMIGPDFRLPLCGMQRENFEKLRTILKEKKVI